MNGGITALVRTLAIELTPVRVNAIHPGIVGDSPYWADKREMLEKVRARTPTGRLVTMQDIVDAVVAILAAGLGRRDMSAIAAFLRSPDPA